MGKYVIENKYLKVTIRRKGAEMRSIVKKSTGAEYLWSGDETYWKWTAPLLFPFIGSLKNQSFRYQNREYPMCQHGFARDYEFYITEQKPEEVWFACKANRETKEKYPFDFLLEVGYVLEGQQVLVKWRVTNTDRKTLYFAIGGHPGFRCPFGKEDSRTDCYIGFDTEADALRYRQVSRTQPLIGPENHMLLLEGGRCRISKSMFDRDALIVENRQAGEVWLAGADQKPYVGVRFDAPRFALWSVPDDQAPFICIEPWYGRGDDEDFEGSLEEREYLNAREPGEIFLGSYRIVIY